MFDPSLIPSKIWPAAKVQALNEMIARLETRKVAAKDTDHLDCIQAPGIPPHPLP